MSRTFAYCRVSTTDQTAAGQVRQIKAAGFRLEPSRVVQEIVAGAVPANERKEFKRLQGQLAGGDVLVVTKLDQLGRNATDVRRTVEGLAACGVGVHCLALGDMDLTGPAGKATMDVLAAVVQFEMDLFIERTQAGLKRAKAEGKQLGRKSVLTSEEQETIYVRRKTGDSLGKLAKEFGVNRSTIQRVEKRLARKMPD